MKHRNGDGSVRSKAVPCRRNHGCELRGSTGYKATRTTGSWDIWPRPLTQQASADHFFEENMSGDNDLS